MNVKWIPVLLLLLTTIPAGAAEPAGQVALKTWKDRVNYSIGVSEVRKFRQEGIEIDYDVLIKGMKDALSGEKLLLSEEELQATISQLQEELRMRQRGLRRAGAEGR